MNKIILTLLLLLTAFAGTSFAQSDPQIAKYLPKKTTDPNCTRVGQLYYNTSLSKEKICSVVGSPGTWDTTVSGISGASLALDNLASVAINAALIPASAAGLDFGSALKPWKDFYFAGSSGTPGTNNFKLTGTSTSGTRTITVADGNTTLVPGTMFPTSGGTLTGALLFTDNTLDIGAAGATRPRTGYFGTSLVVGAGSAITSSGAGGALGTNAFTSTAYAPLASPTFAGTVNAAETIFTPLVSTGTGATAGVQILANSLTTGNGLDASSTSLTTGNLVKLASTGTVAGSNTQTVFNIATSGTNGTSAQTTYGAQFANTHAGTTSTNIAAQFSSSGGLTDNIAVKITGGQLLSTVNGAVSAGTGTLTGSAALFNGTWVTGGSATTNKPYFLIEPTGTTSAAWSTSGTGLGINAASGFLGNLFDFQLNGVSKFAVGYAGTITGANTFQISSGSFGFLNKSYISGSTTDGVITLQNQATNGFRTLVIGSTTPATIGTAPAQNQSFAILQAMESLTIAAAASTTTTMLIPAGAVVLGVSVRVTTVIPTAATFTVTVGGVTCNTAAVSVAANTTDAGTAGGHFYNGTAQGVTITPNLTPGAGTGVVRVTVIYALVTPPTS
jgi:hypothetical protein